MATIFAILTDVAGLPPSIRIRDVHPDVSLAKLAKEANRLAEASGFSCTDAEDCLSLCFDRPDCNPSELPQLTRVWMEDEGFEYLGCRGGWDFYIAQG